MKASLSPFRIAVTLYVCGAIFGFGPIAVALRNGVPPGPRHDERGDYAV